MVNDERLLMKRKDIDRAKEEFSDFSLSSPARKIRRLDVKFPPIIEEEETDVAMQETGAEEEHEPAPVNEERAIVLFKPLHYHQPPSGQLYADRDLISGFNNRFLRDASRADDEHGEDQTSKKCQAVVCWNPSQSPYSQSIGTFQQPRALEIIELDESGEDAVMDDAAAVIEEDNRSSGLSFPQQGQQQLQQEVPTNGFGFQQWQQQQHCMVPQLPQVNSTPITWFR
ncbi:hypothetical protein EUTSA_v10003466mg [Eutrema salsugineum]|uniref:Uncharacterized protein n=1 Tax=Eutrema salsugineum TaxID=72664 RepID=V4LXB7_EUTSA|nr:uncharacterized protein LOC18020395 [Eutrema salsugineum]ESQ44523.1 hypothetical protein EUTSA_v10003466mg [Eutrema salsugineum]